MGSWLPKPWSKTEKEVFRMGLVLEKRKVYLKLELKSG